MAVGLALLSTSLLCSATADARTYVVDALGTGDFEHISDAIASVQDGDSVFVMPGDYDDPYGTSEPLEVEGIKWSLVGASTRTVSLRGFRLNLRGSDTQMAGFTFLRATDPVTQTGGTLTCQDVDFVEVVSGEWSPSAILVFPTTEFPQPSLVLESCRFVRCRATYPISNSTGAVLSNAGSVAIRRCIFQGNESQGAAGAIQCFSEGELVIENSLFSRNVGTTGAVVTYHQPDPSRITSCTFVDNVLTDPGSGGAVTMINGGVLTMENTIIANTTGGWGVAVELSGQVQCCCLFNNDRGMVAGRVSTTAAFDEDPLFCDAANTDLGLQGGSPCLPAIHDGVACGIIGAHPLGCGVSPTHDTSWGRLKSMYRK